MPNFPITPLLIFVAICAFFSSTETSLFSLSRFQLRQIRQRNPDLFQKIKHLLDRPAAFVATILLGNELSNVLASRYLTKYYLQFELTSWQITLINLLSVIPIILVFGEITPKVIGAKANINVVGTLLTPFWWFYRFSFPFRYLIEKFVDIFTKRLQKSSQPREEQIKEEDIRQLLEDGKKKGAIHSVEQGIIENLFDIDDDKIIDLATPLEECFCVLESDSPKSIIDRLNKSFHSRIPVRDSDSKVITGILYAKDLLSYINRDESEMTARDLMKEALFVEANMKVEALFRRFRQLKRHIAIIEDKQEASLYVITMEDILEQIFGELWEEAK